MQILEEIDSQLLGSGNQRLKGIPGGDAIGGACLQTHIAFAHALSGPQFSRIIVQKDFRMGKDHEELLSLFQGPPLALIQLLVATCGSKELIKVRR